MQLYIFRVGDSLCEYEGIEKLFCPMSVPISILDRLQIEKNNPGVSIDRQTSLFISADVEYSS